MHPITLHSVTDGRYGTLTIDGTQSNPAVLAVHYSPSGAPALDAFIRLHAHRASQLSERYGIRYDHDEVMYVVEGPPLELISTRCAVHSLLDDRIVALLSLPSVSLVNNKPGRFFKNCEHLFTLELEAMRFKGTEISDAQTLFELNVETIMRHLPFAARN